MPPKKVPQNVSASSSNVNTPISKIRELSTDLSNIKADWKCDFEMLSNKLKNELKSELTDFLGERNLNQSEVMPCFLDDKINSELKKLEASWTVKFDNIESRIKEIKISILEVNDKIDSLDQYGRNQTLIVHGIIEKENEDSYSVITDFLNKKFDGSFIQTDFVNVHRLGRKRIVKNDSDEDNFTRPIIMKFHKMKQRDLVFQKKKLLKGCGKTIFENLTNDRRYIYNSLRKKDINCWTQNGDIIVLLEGKKIILKKLSEMNDFLNKLEPHII